jgi:hypothetical protein
MNEFMDSRSDRRSVKPISCLVIEALLMIGSLRAAPMMAREGLFPTPEAECTNASDLVA